MLVTLIKVILISHGAGGGGAGENGNPGFLRHSPRVQSLWPSWAHWGVTCLNTRTADPELILPPEHSLPFL